MSQNIDQRSPQDRDPPAPDSVQGEGDYEAAPASAREARDLALAEDRARDSSKGDDAADPGIMYPGRRIDAER